MRIPVKAITPDQLKGPLEAILIATKAHDTADAVRERVPHMGPDSFIVHYQNGLNIPVIVDLLKEAGHRRRGALSVGSRTMAAPW